MVVINGICGCDEIRYVYFLRAIRNAIGADVRVTPNELAYSAHVCAEVRISSQAFILRRGGIIAPLFEETVSIPRVD